MELVVKEVKKVKISANNINSFLVVSNAKLKRIRMDETNLFNKLQQQQKRKNKEKSIESKKDINDSKKTKKGIIGKKTKSIWDKILLFFGIMGLGILLETLPKVFNNIRKFLRENEWLKQGIIFIFKTIAGAAMVMKNIYEFFAGKDLNKDKLAKQRKEVDKNISVFERDVKLITNGVNDKLKINEVDDDDEDEEVEVKDDKKGEVEGRKPPLPKSQKDEVGDNNDNPMHFSNLTKEMSNNKMSTIK